MSVGPNSPGASDQYDQPGSTGLWNTPDNILLSDDGYATVTVRNVIPHSHYLLATEFGFAIDPGESILGIEASIEHSNGGFGVGRIAELSEVGLWLGPTTADNSIGTPKTPGDQPTGTDSVVNVGGSSDTWGAALTPAIVNDENFAVWIKYSWVSGTIVTPAVDHITCTVHHGSGASSSGIGWIHQLLFKH